MHRYHPRIAVSCWLVLFALSGGRAAALDITSAFSPRNRARPARKSTQYIILHTTEGPTAPSLRKVRANGETHYLVDTRGKVYRVIHKKRVAMHAGRSMWRGQTNLDNHAIGIEVVGYHNKDITSAQYRALKNLVAELQSIYRVPDDHVLTHSMVAYGAPNRWHKKSHSGRKRCGMLFAKKSVRRKLGLDGEPTFDPDVTAGRLTVGDPYLAKVLYGSAREQESAVTRFSGSDACVISKGRSAWDIARDKYKSAETTYVFPDGTEKRGNKVRNWKKIPVGTKVPVGYLDRDKGAWIPSPDGRVIKIIDLDADLAVLDTDGDGVADSGRGIGEGNRNHTADDLGSNVFIKGLWAELKGFPLPAWAEAPGNDTGD